jgi:membrane associated rhomboid family serine protease
LLKIQRIKGRGTRVYFFYYFPVGLDLRTRRTPVITIFLFVFCVIAFIFYRYIPSGNHWNLYNLIFMPSAPTLATSLSHLFLHASWVHLIGNMIYLYIFGKALEDRFGPGRFFAIFALSAMAGAWTHVALVSTFSPEYLGYGVIGASGATSGLLGAFMVRLYFSRIRVAYWIFMPLHGMNKAGRRYVHSVIAVFCWFIYQGIYAVMQFGSSGVGVAYSVHVGGFAAGAVLALAFGSVPLARAERRLAKARRYFEKSNFFGAQSEYLEYLQMRPSDVHAHLEAARAFRCGHDLGRVKYHYNEAASILMSDSMRGEAEEVLIEAMRTVPGFTLKGELHLDVAYGMERSMKYGKSLTAYENFKKRYPHSDEAPFILLRMAAIHERRFSRGREALECYRELVETHPDDCWVDFALGEIERLSGYETYLEGNGREIMDR